MSNLSALKQILTALGGTPAASDSNDETIAKTATALGTKEFLPSVTSEDKGKVPTVSNDGEWELATPGGGGGVLVCNFDMGTMALDHTWQEIEDAAETGIVILSGMNESSMDVMYLKGTTFAEGANYTVSFGMVVDGPDGATVNVMTFSSETANGYPALVGGGGGGGGGGVTPA